jgi:hypothetical protein
MKLDEKTRSMMAAKLLPMTRAQGTDALARAFLASSISDEIEKLVQQLEGHDLRALPADVLVQSFSAQDMMLLALAHQELLKIIATRTSPDLYEAMELSLDSDDLMNIVSDILGTTIPAPLIQ